MPVHVELPTTRCFAWMPASAEMTENGVAACKDIDTAMANQDDLVEVVHTLGQVVA